LEIIAKVENLNMTKVSNINLELFDRLDSNMESFNQFSKYLKLMNKISENLFNFSTKTENIDAITKDIKYTLKDSQELTRFLTSHFQQIQSAGGAALNAVDLSDSHFREAIDKLTVETNARIALLNNISDTSEVTLKETFDNLGSKLNEIADKHINSLKGAYNESVPHFEQLDNLKLLPDLSNQSTSQSKELIDSINQLNRSLGSIINKMDNQAVLNKLETIEKSLKSRSKIKSNSTSKPTKFGFFKRLQNSFKRKEKISSHEEK